MHELILHYQPKIQLGTGAICGVEALVRWQHPARGVLLPGMFMAEVERSELLAPLTQWVLNEALRQQRAWQDGGIDLTMAVNISAHSLTARSTLLASLEQTQKTWETKPDHLILELTESALIESDAPRVLTQVHDMGIGLSIDDFGTGYSSLSYLRRLPVDEIKIDRSFVTSLASRGEDDDDAVIVRSTIELAHISVSPSSPKASRTASPCTCWATTVATAPRVFPRPPMSRPGTHAAARSRGVCVLTGPSLRVGWSGRAEQAGTGALGDRRRALRESPGRFVSSK